MVIDHAIDHLYQDAIRQEKAVPVAQAEIVEVISESPLKFKVHVEVLPEAKITDKYKKIKLKKTLITVSDKEVENALDEIQTKFTKFEEGNEKDTVKEGDRVTIDTT
jgi:FKBP-type peptidyl-prolyl cis-trans isomerase (trigger factor)